MTEGYYLKQKKKSKFLSLMTNLQARAVLVSMVLVVLMVSMGVFYLVQINVLSTKGYQINNLKVRITELEEQNKQFELNVAELQSIKKISERVESLGMVKVAITDYISPAGSSVAVR